MGHPAEIGATSTTGISSAHGVDDISVHVDEKHLAIADSSSAFEDATSPSNSQENINVEKVVLPEDEDAFIDPRLKNYPVPLVAKTVSLHNDPT